MVGPQSRGAAAATGRKPAGSAENNGRLSLWTAVSQAKARLRSQGIRAGSQGGGRRRQRGGERRHRLMLAASGIRLLSPPTLCLAFPWMHACTSNAEFRTGKGKEMAKEWKGNGRQEMARKGKSTTTLLPAGLSRDKFSAGWGVATPLWHPCCSLRFSLPVFLVQHQPILWRNTIKRNY